ncbi:YdcF family protein [Breznakiella homolactica]|uniref:YdcF family protein n=1 Tax=Breznakiella homolactica TaxID=2798577 RepID=A0A7T7XPM7_9SPIR|nr:YdcF family protein [Breznakiella homolactica]QQO10166.1 YdcF family protein [Breznakiella homolactica]
MEHDTDTGSGTPAGNTARGCIIILGSPNDNEGNLSPIAESRLTRGAGELNRHPGFRILLTGGFGKHFNETNQPHWKYARDFLLRERSVPEEAFLPEAAESGNTVEDLEISRPLILKYGIRNIIIVTSEFHVPRARYIAEKVFADSGVTLDFSGASDAELDENLLRSLREHETQAIEYLKKNYRVTPA